MSGPSEGLFWAGSFYWIIQKGSSDSNVIQCSSLSLVYRVSIHSAEVHSFLSKSVLEMWKTSILSGPEYELS